MNGRLMSSIDRAGPLLLALVIAIVAVVYVSNAYLSSSRIHNVIFIIPMATIAVILAGIVLLRVALAWRASSRGVSDVEARSVDQTADAETGVGGLGIAAMMALLIAYAFSIPWIGFDVASVLFMAACLWIQGERRPLVVVAMSLIFSFGVTWLLINGARVPAHTMFL
ncbi:MAG: tripartite tricarboxylate transporter TctB family protein [Microvirga sp.]|nr:tripartite tricarboxylate transporter TctB family protein [Microvirga sp.]